jgi:hypothetical protein
VEEFFERHPHPVLVVAPFAAEDDPRFKTVAGAPGSESSGLWWIAPVAKRPGSNVFTSMVTIGRARNNDIELKTSAVSKFHAYVTLGPDGPTLVDAGSTFGTYVGDKRLTPRGERHPLSTGDVLRLGAVSMTYMDPAAFHAHLRRAGEEPLRAAG